MEKEASSNKTTENLIRNLTLQYEEASDWCLSQWDDDPWGTEDHYEEPDKYSDFDPESEKEMLGHCCPLCGDSGAVWGDVLPNFPEDRTIDPDKLYDCPKGCPQRKTVGSV